MIEQITVAKLRRLSDKNQVPLWIKRTISLWTAMEINLAMFTVYINDRVSNYYEANVNFEIFLFQRWLPKRHMINLQKFYVSSKHEKECYMKMTSYLEEPNCHFCQNFMWRMTQQTFSAINLASQQKTTKLFFSSLHLSHYAVVCAVISLWTAMFENSTKIYKLSHV